MKNIYASRNEESNAIDGPGSIRANYRVSKNNPWEDISRLDKTISSSLRRGTISSTRVKIALYTNLRSMPEETKEQMKEPIDKLIRLGLEVLREELSYNKIDTPNAILNMVMLPLLLQSSNEHLADEIDKTTFTVLNALREELEADPIKSMKNVALFIKVVPDEFIERAEAVFRRLLVGLCEGIADRVESNKLLSDKGSYIINQISKISIKNRKDDLEEALKASTEKILKSIDANQEDRRINSYQGSVAIKNLSDSLNRKSRAELNEDFNRALNSIIKKVASDLEKSRIGLYAANNCIDLLSEVMERQSSEENSLALRELTSAVVEEGNK